MTPFKDLNYLDDRTFKERASEPKGVTTSTTPKNWREEFEKRFNWDAVFGKNSKAQSALTDFISQVEAQAREDERKKILQAYRQTTGIDADIFTKTLVNNLPE